jgi:hypothetical protein
VIVNVGLVPTQSGRNGQARTRHRTDPGRTTATTLRPRSRCSHSGRVRPGTAARPARDVDVTGLGTIESEMQFTSLESRAFDTGCPPVGQPFHGGDGLDHCLRGSVDWNPLFVIGGSSICRQLRCAGHRARAASSLPALIMVSSAISTPPNGISGWLLANATALSRSSAVNQGVTAEHGVGPAVAQARSVERGVAPILEMRAEAFEPGRPGLECFRAGLKLGATRLVIR